jgi:flagellar hook-associated protein 1 FlgK
VSQDGSKTGAITIRGSDGTALTTLGRSPAVFTYDQSNGSGQLLFTPPGGQQQPYGTRLTSGELEGLLHAQNTDLPNLSQQLAEFTAGTASALNQASNAYSSTPAPAALTGKDIGIDVPSAIANFTGKTTIAIVNAQGVIQQSVAIDFTAKTFSINGAAAATFGTAAAFVANLNTALAPAGGASVTGSVLSLTASGGNGVVVADDPTTPSQLGSKGFSQYFGLNDVVTSKGASDYSTGLTAGSASGFTSGTIKFRVATGDGTDVADISVAPTSGQTLGQLVTQLNGASGGLGAYGSFALDSNGAIAFTARSGSNLNLGVISDTTTWNGTGPSFTQLFGIDPATRTYRTGNLSVNPAIVQQPSLLPNAKLSLTGAAGSIALAPGDTRGADALGQAGMTLRSFQAAGLAPASTVTLSNYSAALSARIGAAAANASTSATNATTAATEAESRRSGVEGVNLDQELISLTTYQQAYNASARLLTAAKDMYDTLLGIVR